MEDVHARHGTPDADRTRRDSPDPDLARRGSADRARRGSPDPAVIEDLVLVRLLAVSKSNAPGPKKLRDELYPFFQSRLSPGDWNTHLEATLQQLDSAGLIARKPFALSDQGRQRALRFLGINDLPPRVTWSQLRDTYLVSKAFGLAPQSSEARKAVKQADRLRGLIVKHQLDLATAEFPTLRQAIDAVAWRRLGIETSVPFNEKNVVRFLLGEDLKRPSRLATSQLRNQFPTQLLKTSSTDPSEIRWEMLRKLVGSQDARPHTTSMMEEAASSTAPPPAESASTEPAPFDLDEFSRQVLHAANSVVDGRFGENKVFINRIWHAVQDTELARQLDFDQFKRLLADANNQGLLSLSRADLVGAMDPQDVAQSETKYLNATFHFVQV
jgi:hypothetical protein